MMVTRIFMLCFMISHGAFTWSYQLDNGPCPIENPDGFCVQVHNTGHTTMRFKVPFMFEDGMREVSSGQYAHFKMRHLSQHRPQKVILFPAYASAKLDESCQNVSYAQALAKGASYDISITSPGLTEIELGYRLSESSSQSPKIYCY